MADDCEETDLQKLLGCFGSLVLFVVPGALWLYFFGADPEPFEGETAFWSWVVILYYAYWLIRYGTPGSG